MYTGKYPNKIMNVIAVRGYLEVQTNTGTTRLSLYALNNGAPLPVKGDDFEEYKKTNLKPVETPPTARDTNAPIVAQLIGFDLVPRFAELPVGFRLNWEDMEADVRYEDTLTYGEMVDLYFTVTRERRQPKPTI